MAETNAIFETLKHELKAHEKTYQDVAEALSLTEASIKQMFSTNRISLERLDKICTSVLGIEISELVQLMNDRVPLVATLTELQERQLVANERLLLVAVLVMNNWKVDELVEQFEMETGECLQHLQALVKLKLISVRPGNRIKLLIDRNFSWLANGPIEKYFQQNIQSEFLDSSFDRPGETRVFRTGMLTRKSSIELIARIDKLISEFMDLNREDSKLNLNHRIGYSFIVALRPWLMSAFAEMKRE